MFDVQLFRQYLWYSCMMEIQVPFYVSFPSNPFKSEDVMNYSVDSVLKTSLKANVKLTEKF